MSTATALTVAPPTAAPNEGDRAAPNEGDRVFRWRCEELRRAGYGAEAASLLAAIPDLDLDLAIELRARRLMRLDAAQDFLL